MTVWQISPCGPDLAVDDVASRCNVHHTLLETCHQVFFRKTLLFSMETEGVLPKCQFEMEKQIKFTRAFFAFGGFSKKNNKITPFSFHLCNLAIFNARALKFWLQVALKIDPKSYFMGHDPKRSFSWRFFYFSEFFLL